MTSLIRSFEYEIPSMSPNYLLEGKEIWMTSLRRNLVLLAGATFSTSKVKHFFMQSRGGPHQTPAASAEERPRRRSWGTTAAGEEQLQQGWEADVKNTSSGNTEQCWGLCWFGLSSVNNPPPAAGHCGTTQPRRKLYSAVEFEDVLGPAIPSPVPCQGRWSSCKD